jgi:hypothetical protein
VHLGGDLIVSNYTSDYTSIASKDCHSINDLERKYYINHGLSLKKDDHGVRVVKCQSYQELSVCLISSDDDSWIDIKKNGEVFSTERLVLMESELGFNPYIGSEKLEWRTDSKNKEDTFIIVRISAQNKKNQLIKNSKLYILKLNKSQWYFCGSANTNQDARALIVNSEKCSKR